MVAKALTGLKIFSVSEVGNFTSELEQKVITSMITMQPRFGNCTRTIFTASFWGLGRLKLQRVIGQRLPRMAFGELVY